MSPDSMVCRIGCQHDDPAAATWRDENLARSANCRRAEAHVAINLEVSVLRESKRMIPVYS
jgi:hypothetical protein